MRLDPKSRHRLPHFFAQEETRNLLAKLKEAGVNSIEPLPPAAAGGNLEGKIFVFTGTLPSLTREDAKRLVEEKEDG